MKRTVTIEGMSCEHCAANVKKALEGVGGVSNVKVKLKAKLAAVEADASVTDERLTAAITDAGYKIVNIR